MVAASTGARRSVAPARYQCFGGSSTYTSPGRGGGFSSGVGAMPHPQPPMINTQVHWMVEPHGVLNFFDAVERRTRLSNADSLPGAQYLLNTVGS